MEAHLYIFCDITGSRNIIVDTSDSDTRNRRAIVVHSHSLELIVVNNITDTAGTSNPRLHARVSKGEPDSLTFHRFLQGSAFIRENIQREGFSSKCSINFVSQRINLLMNFTFELVHTIFQYIHPSGERIFIGNIQHHRLILRCIELAGLRNGGEESDWPGCESGQEEL